MADLRAYVANCLVGGHTFTRERQHVTRDTIELVCDGKTLVLKQRPDVASGRFQALKGTFADTTQILVSDVAGSEVTKTLDIVYRVCWLLSLAGLSRVVCYGYDYPDRSGNSSRHTAFGTAEFFRPTLEIRDGRLIKAFIEQTYPTFKRLERSRKLNVVIDYLLQAERPSQPTECKLLFAFVLLENLKDTFARSKGIPYQKGFFRKSVGPRSRKYSFEELLQLMFADVRMRRGLKRIVRLRNDIVHSGLTRRPHAKNWAMYERIHDIVREYLLRVLGYRGEYLVYSRGSNAVAMV
mgnify:CR=1 FL=1|jgi:hypothetical protein